MKLTHGHRTITLRHTTPAEDETHDGFYDANTDTIAISANIPPERQGEVLLHELTHVLLTSSGLSTQLGPKLEEAVCQAVGHGLAGLFNRNAPLARAVCKALDKPACILNLR